MDAWHREIVELHDFFEAYFLGNLAAEDVGRLQVALAGDFTFINPTGAASTRGEVEAAIVAGYSHATQLRITITDAQLLVESDEIVVARYVENHEMAAASNHRISTVVFSRDEAAPNGLRWRSVHETWLENSSG